MALMRIQPSAAAPSPRSATEVALEQLDRVYAFIYARVGNRHDAEDLTQVVAMKAMPRLRDGACDAEIAAYMFAAARSALASFWERRGRLPEAYLPDDVRASGPSAPEASAETAESVAAILRALRPSHRRVLELRFLHGYSLKEAAAEMGNTVGGVKLMQLRALRAAALVMDVGRVSKPFGAA